MHPAQFLFIFLQFYNNHAYKAIIRSFTTRRSLSFVHRFHKQTPTHLPLTISIAIAFPFFSRNLHVMRRKRTQTVFFIYIFAPICHTRVIWNIVMFFNIRFLVSTTLSLSLYAQVHTQ